MSTLVMAMAYSIVSSSSRTFPGNRGEEASSSLRWSNLDPFFHLPIEAFHEVLHEGGMSSFLSLKGGDRSDDMDPVKRSLRKRPF